MSGNFNEADDDEVSTVLVQLPLRVDYNRTKETIVLIDDWTDGGPYSVAISVHFWPALVRAVEQHTKTAQS